MKRHLLAAAVALLATTPHAFAVQEHHTQPTGQQAVVGQPTVGQTSQSQGWVAPGVTGAMATPTMVLGPGIPAPGGGCMMPMMPMMGQGGMGMMGAMMPMMGQGGMGAAGQGMALMAPGAQPAMGAQGMGLGDGVDRIEGRIAFLRAEVGITELQAPAWDAFAQAIRTVASHVGAPRMAMANTAGPITLTQSLEAQDAALSARLDDVKALRSALAQLNETLSDDQRKTAEELIPLVVGAVIAG